MISLVSLSLTEPCEPPACRIPKLMAHRLHTLSAATARARFLHHRELMSLVLSLCWHEAQHTFTSIPCGFF